MKLVRTEKILLAVHAYAEIEVQIFARRVLVAKAYAPLLLIGAVVVDAEGRNCGELPIEFPLCEKLRIEIAAPGSSLRRRLRGSPTRCGDRGTETRIGGAHRLPDILGEKPVADLRLIRALSESERALEEKQSVGWSLKILKGLRIFVLTFERQRLVAAERLRNRGEEAGPGSTDRSKLCAECAVLRKIRIVRAPLVEAPVIIAGVHVGRRIQVIRVLDFEKLKRILDNVIGLKHGRAGLGLKGKRRDEAREIRILLVGRRSWKRAGKRTEKRGTAAEILEPVEAAIAGVFALICVALEDL